MNKLFLCLVVVFVAVSQQLSQESKANLLTCVTVIQFLLYGSEEDTKEAIEVIMAHSEEFDEKKARDHLMSLFVANCYRTMTKEIQMKITNELSKKKKISVKSKDISTLVDYEGIVDMYRKNDTVAIVKLVKEFKEVEKIMNSEEFRESSFYSQNGDLGLFGFSIKNLTLRQKNMIGLVLFVVIAGMLAYLMNKLLKKEDKKKKKKQR